MWRSVDELVVDDVGMVGGATLGAAAEGVGGGGPGVGGAAGGPVVGAGTGGRSGAGPSVLIRKGLAKVPLTIVPLRTMSR